MLLFAGEEYVNEELLKPFNEKFEIQLPLQKKLLDYNTKVCKYNIFKYWNILNMYFFLNFNTRNIKNWSIKFEHFILVKMAKLIKLTFQSTWIWYRIYGSHME